MAGLDDPSAAPPPEDDGAVQTADILREEVAQISYPGADRVDAQEPPGQTSPEGPLGALISGAPKSPSRFFPEIAQVDQKWQDDYKLLSDMDGHKLVDAYDDAVENVIKEHGKLPEDERQRTEKMVDEALWSGQITPETEKELSQHQDLLKALQEVGKLRADPTNLEALKLRETARRDMGDAIYAREATAGVLTQFHQEGKGNPIPDGTSYPDAAAAITREAEILKQYRTR